MEYFFMRWFYGKGGGDPGFLDLRVLFFSLLFGLFFCCEKEWIFVSAVRFILS